MSDVHGFLLFDPEVVLEDLKKAAGIDSIGSWWALKTRNLLSCRFAETPLGSPWIESIWLQHPFLCFTIWLAYISWLKLAQITSNYHSFTNQIIKQWEKTNTTTWPSPRHVEDPGEGHRCTPFHHIHGGQFAQTVETKLLLVAGILRVCRFYKMKNTWARGWGSQGKEAWLVGRWVGWLVKYEPLDAKICQARATLLGKRCDMCLRVFQVLLSLRSWETKNSACMSVWNAVTILMSEPNH